MTRYKFRSKPFKHQRRGLKRLWKQGGGMLAWEPGTGKTKTAIDYAAALHLKGKVNRVLILCPINAFQVWPTQLQRHMPTDIAHSLIMPEGSVIQKAAHIRDIQLDNHLSFVMLNYEAIIKRGKDWPMMDALTYYQPDMVILDESQKVKNATAKRSKAAHKLGEAAQYKVLMSGTPVSKNYLDLYSQLKVLDPKIWADPEAHLGIMSWTFFKFKYGKWGGRTGYELKGYQNLDDLRRRYLPWISSARKSECLDLPPVTDIIIPIQMNDKAREVYKIMAQDGIAYWNDHLFDAPIALTKLLRLQEMTGGGVHDEAGELVSFQTDKLEVLRGMLEDLRENDEKVVVFARFKWEMDAMIPLVDISIRGGVSANQRQIIVDTFLYTQGPIVLLIQIAAGEALDGLQAVCSHAIYYSTDYSWDHFVQSRGRLDRQGQTVAVTFYHLHMVGTVDKLVYRALMQKKNLEKMVMDDPDILVTD